MKRLATMLAAGALALFASLLVMVETADQANAFMRLGGFGGGMRSFGGGMRSFGGGMRPFGGGMRSFGGARSFGAGGGAVMRSNVSARPISTTSVGRTNTVSHVNVSKGSSVKQANIRNTRSSKDVNVAKTNTSTNIAKTTTGKLANVRKPNIGKQVATANLGATHVNASNSKTNTHVNIGNTNKLGPGGITQGPGNRLAGGPAGLARPPSPRLMPSGPPPGGFKPAPGSMTVINDRYVSIFRGPRQIWWAGAWVSLAALAVIPAVYIGGIDYEPYGYVALAEPVCSGVTPEGYRLTWRDVPTDTGATIPQCVAYYPRGRAAPAVATGAAPGQTVGAAPGQTVGAAQPVMSAMAQACLVEIYSEVAFAGMSSDVAADQPRLSDYGWDKQISSLDLKAGTWDFYSEPDYGGQMVRLPPGQYENLEGWAKLISSFMCTQVNDSRDWVKSKDSAAPAEEDWGKEIWR